MWCANDVNCYDRNWDIFTTTATDFSASYTHLPRMYWHRIEVRIEMLHRIEVRVEMLHRIEERSE